MDMDVSVCFRWVETYYGFTLTFVSSTENNIIDFTEPIVFSVCVSSTLFHHFVMCTCAKYKLLPLINLIPTVLALMFGEMNSIS